MTASTAGRASRLTAFAFFFIWLGAAYAVADKPPPPGFIYIVGWILALAALTNLRLRSYLTRGGPSPYSRLVAEGAFWGAIVGGAILAMTVASGDADATRAGWVVVVTGVVLGATNAVGMYALAHFIERMPPPEEYD
jgi:hypothetical protein